MKINKYEDISQIDREAKKDYIDRHSAFVYCEDKTKAGVNFKVKVKEVMERILPELNDELAKAFHLKNMDELKEALLAM